MSKKIIYYVVIKPYPKKDSTVRAVYLDGRTKDWQHGDPGFEAAYKRGMASKKRYL